MVYFEVVYNKITREKATIELYEVQKSGLTSRPMESVSADFLIPYRLLRGTVVFWGLIFFFFTKKKKIHKKQKKRAKKYTLPYLEQNVYLVVYFYKCVFRALSMFLGNGNHFLNTAVDVHYQQKLKRHLTQTSPKQFFTIFHQAHPPECSRDSTATNL